MTDPAPFDLTGDMKAHLAASQHETDPHMAFHVRSALPIPSPLCATCNGEKPACILTGAPGENPDDCTTHSHEGDSSDKTVLYVLSVNHRHGDTVSIYTTQQFAREGLIEYVVEWYQQELNEPCPDEVTDEVINDYFDRTDESWSIEESAILR